MKMHWLRRVGLLAILPASGCFFFDWDFEGVAPKDAAGGQGRQHAGAGHLQPAHGPERHDRTQDGGHRQAH